MSSSAVMPVLPVVTQNSAPFAARLITLKSVDIKSHTSALCDVASGVHSGSYGLNEMPVVVIRNGGKRNGQFNERQRTKFGINR